MLFNTYDSDSIDEEVSEGSVSEGCGQRCQSKGERLGLHCNVVLILVQSKRKFCGWYVERSAELSYDTRMDRARSLGPDVYVLFERNGGID
jgi:hypothetical protein